MQVLLNLLAGVALLVWGTHIVRTDILRLYGGDLRRVLRESVSNRFAAFGAGLSVTAVAGLSLVTTGVPVWTTGRVVCTSSEGVS